MNKFLLGVLIVAACFWVGNRIVMEWKEKAQQPVNERRTFADEYLSEERLVHPGNRPDGGEAAKSSGSSKPSPSAPATARTANLPGLPASLKSSLASAKNAGAQSFKVWIQKHRGKIEDPALADIELDYVVAVGRENFIEAKRTYARVAERIDASSPVYERLKSLEAAYK